ncbi:MAG: hypothetical protein JWN31_1175 [Frankiales bacterium]|nr:hypothetical protein [Frankiales bacterium]
MVTAAPYGKPVSPPGMLAGMPRHRLRKLLGLPSLYVDPDHVFTDSRSYWERRYAKGRDSGPGSYEELAAFKAAVLNAFVSEHGLTSVVELGCGDGNQVSMADYPSYIGLDVSATAIDRCAERFADDTTKSFFLYDPVRFVDRAGVFRSDLTMSLDVIYHLVEDEVFDRHMSLLFDLARSYVCIYSSNEEIADEWPHVRHRAFTAWVVENRPGWQLMDTVKNPLKDVHTGAVADFYFYRRPGS